MRGRILALDVNGLPHKWISHNDAITYHAKGLVVWQLGQDEASVTFRGGENRLTGTLSELTTAPIIAIRGESASIKRMNKPPALTNRALFQRDDHQCAYCGQYYREDELTRDHVVPTSRGGLDIWTNVVTSCAGCNNWKDNKLVEECHGLEMHFKAYAPNRAEVLIFEARHIEKVQLDYLVNFIPAHSRILNRRFA